MDHIGSGAMGIVWRARDERLDRTVAVKQLMMRAGLSESQAADARRRAMREGRIAARLQHRNAIALFDVAEHDGDPCLIMEYLPSLSLSGLLAERGTLPPEEAAQIGVQVATALTAAHAAGIVHRDVKPGNILIDQGGQVKITDFGISRSTDDGTMTQSSVGMLAGTPAYLAPEVARGQDPTRASDVFSLGATLYHVVEGQPPYGFKDNPLAQLYAVAMGKVPEPKQAGPMSKTLMRLLSAEPADRPTMPELVASFGELAGGATVVVPRETINPPVAPKPVPNQPAPVQQTLIAPTPAAAPTAVSVQAAPKPVEQRPVSPPRTPPPPPPRPAEPRKPGGSKRVAGIVGAIVAAAVLGGVIATVLSTSGSKDQGAQQPTITQPQDTVTKLVTPTQTPSQPSNPSNAVGNEGGAIDWRSAGLAVVAYYSGDKSAQERWGMLTPKAQQMFGDFAAFEQYWAQYPQVSGRGANRTATDPDGGEQIAYNVNYGGGNTTTRTVRIVRQGGKLLIDSDAK
ncbi:serine/threonine-protein kinase [Actinosynnema sp. ALI-1.44]|uniref:serine/threonine-protein kinase n=1 Tax=Actinosynnema sp. ALI-1.44 TaxID=1933779 RepID=UPI0022A9528E|nr:serine/threonine-protein kinase [Actinosynnema sp. ALI-1.44]